MLDEELRSRRVRLKLLKAQRDVALASLARMATRLGLLGERLALQRRGEAEKLIADADDAALSEGVDHPLVDALIARNRELGEELTRLTNELEKTEAAETAVQARSVKRIEIRREGRAQTVGAGQRGTPKIPGGGLEYHRRGGVSTQHLKRVDNALGGGAGLCAWAARVTVRAAA